MFFTQEDYKKIKDYLLLDSIRDSDMEESLTLNGKETLSIVKEGKNKKVRMMEFLDGLNNLLPNSMINMSEDYNLGSTTLKEAVESLPENKRREGQVITFKDDGNRWYVYQFLGSLSQWTNLSLWEDNIGRLNFTYIDIKDKPSINDIILEGNKTLTELGIQPKGSYVRTDVYNEDKKTFATKTDIKDMETKTHAEKTYQPVGDYATNSALNSAIQDVEGKIPSIDHLATKEALNKEVERNNAQDVSLGNLQDTDVNLQNQIDSLSSRSDVVDIVANKAALDAYDISKITENDVIKVLKDETRNNEITYYRLVGSAWEFVGSLGAYYTKSESDGLLNNKVDKIKGKQLSTEDYTREEKAKLGNIEAGAQVNTVNSVAGKQGNVVLDKNDVQLNNVDNTSDLDKPISKATQAALDEKLSFATIPDEVIITDGVTPTKDSNELWVDINGDGYTFDGDPLLQRQGIADAPADGKMYARKDTGWTNINERWTEYHNMPQWFKDALVCYYNPSKQGLSNSEIQAKNGEFKLKDFSPNGLDMYMHGFEGAGMSGMGGYGLDANIIRSNSVDFPVIHLSDTKIKCEYARDLTPNPGLYVANGKPLAKKFKVKVTQSSSNFRVCFLLRKKDVTITKLIYLKPNSINTIVIPDDFYNDYDDFTNFGHADKTNVGDWFELEFLPLYEGGLVFDGVNDWGYVVNTPELQTDKGFTIISDSDILDSDTGILFSDILRGERYGAFGYGNEYLIDFTHPISPLPTPFPMGFSYMTSHSFNGESITKGNDYANTNQYSLGCEYNYHSGVKGSFLKFVLNCIFLFNRDLTSEEINFVKINVMREYVKDAPSDNKAYMRSDGAWVQAPKGGFMRPLYEAAGAFFNEDTGYYELNGLTDLTEEEISKIYINRLRFVGRDISSALHNYTERTNMYSSTVQDVGAKMYHDFTRICQNAINIERFCFSNSYNGVNVSTLQYAFIGCRKLEIIEGILEVGRLTDNFWAFKYCNNLRALKILHLNKDFSFSDSPFLFKSALKYMIDNAANKSLITITLHADAYSRLNADPDIVQAIADAKAKGHEISLASA